MIQHTFHQGECSETGGLAVERKKEDLRTRGLSNWVSNLAVPENTGDFIVSSFVDLITADSDSLGLGWGHSISTPINYQTVTGPNDIWEPLDTLKKYLH